MNKVMYKGRLHKIYIINGKKVIKVLNKKTRKYKFISFYKKLKGGVLNNTFLSNNPNQEKINEFKNFIDKFKNYKNQHYINEYNFKVWNNLYFNVNSTINYLDNKTIIVLKMFYGRDTVSDNDYSLTIQFEIYENVLNIENKINKVLNFKITINNINYFIYKNNTDNTLNQRNFLIFLNKNYSDINIKYLKLIKFVLITSQLYQFLNENSLIKTNDINNFIEKIKIPEYFQTIIDKSSNIKNNINKTKVNIKQIPIELIEKINKHQFDFPDNSKDIYNKFINPLISNDKKIVLFQLDKDYFILIYLNYFINFHLYYNGDNNLNIAEYLNLNIHYYNFLINDHHSFDNIQIDQINLKTIFKFKFIYEYIYEDIYENIYKKIDENLFLNNISFIIENENVTYKLLFYYDDVKLKIKTGNLNYNATDYKDYENEEIQSNLITNIIHLIYAVKIVKLLNNLYLKSNNKLDKFLNTFLDILERTSKGENILFLAIDNKLEEL